MSPAGYCPVCSSLLIGGDWCADCARAEAVLKAQEEELRTAVDKKARAQRTPRSKAKRIKHQVSEEFPAGTRVGAWVVISKEPMVVDMEDKGTQVLYRVRDTKGKTCWKTLRSLRWLRNHGQRVQEE